MVSADLQIIVLTLTIPAIFTRDQGLTPWDKSYATWFRRRQATFKITDTRNRGGFCSLQTENEEPFIFRGY